MTNSEEIRKWMQDVAKGDSPRKRLIFDRASKRLIAVDPSDSRADQNLEFTSQEAQRFKLLVSA